MTSFISKNKFSTQNMHVLDDYHVLTIASSTLGYNYG